jgi:hypothetical protein
MAMLKNKRAAVKVIAGVIFVGSFWMACAKQSTVNRIEKNMVEEFKTVKNELQGTQNKVDSLDKQNLAVSQRISGKLDYLSQQLALINNINDSLKILRDQLEDKKKQSYLNGNLLRRYEFKLASIEEILRSGKYGRIDTIIERQPTYFYSDTSKGLQLNVGDGTFLITSPIGRESKEFFSLIYVPSPVRSEHDSSDYLNTFNIRVVNRESISPFIKFDNLETNGEFVLEGKDYEYSPKVDSTWRLGFEYLQQNEKFPCTLLLTVISRKENKPYDKTKDFYLELERVNPRLRLLLEIGIGLIVSAISFAIGRAWTSIKGGRSSI